MSKWPSPAREFVATDPDFLRLRHRRCVAFVGHVRAATHGDPADNANNHPFVGDQLCLVHNGVLANHREVADKFALRLTTECDSEVLLRLAEAAVHPAIGLGWCLRETTGSMAVAALDADREAVWLAHNGGRPLWLARLRDDRRLFFASTAEILLTALRGVLGRHAEHRLDLLVPVPEGVPLSADVSGRLVAPMAGP